MFFDFDPEGAGRIHEASVFAKSPCHVNCDCGRFLEIGNSVFMEYQKTAKGFQKLAQQNVDFGGGLERTLAALHDNPDVFCAEIFSGAKKALEELSGKTYGKHAEETYAFRIILDHLRAAMFLMGDARGMEPSNTDQGYVLRRLLRRAIRYGKRIGIAHDSWIGLVLQEYIREYGAVYPEFSRNKEQALLWAREEEARFMKTIQQGLRELQRIKVLTGQELFLLYSTYGFPLEMSFEELRISEQDQQKFREEFAREMARHQDLSRTAAEGKFRGGLADHSENVVRLHTATHLLNEALRRAVDPNIKQRGSNITSERLRFDFSFDRKLTDEEISAVEQLVNAKIAEAIPVRREEMPLQEALRLGAQAEFGAKYPDTVSVYMIGDFSKELCGGPHVSNISEVGKFIIQKQEAVAAGIRRIKAILE